MAQSFRDAFCASYRCRPEEFSSKAIAQCLYPHARVVWPVADLLGARTTLAATGLIEKVGEAKSEDDVKEVVEEYLQDVFPHIGVVGKGLKVRVSIKRLLEMYRQVRQT